MKMGEENDLEVTETETGETLKEKMISKNDKIAKLEVENKKLSLQVEELEKEINEASKEADNEDF